MDSGRCVEFAHPHELLEKEEEPRQFFNMLKETGNATFGNLKKVAEQVSEFLIFNYNLFN